MPFESTRSGPSFESAVIAIGLPPAEEGAAVDDAPDADVGDDDALPPDDPQAASNNAAAAARPMAPVHIARFGRARSRVDIIDLIVISVNSEHLDIRSCHRCGSGDRPIVVPDSASRHSSSAALNRPPAVTDI
jgi:hypothetical protein